MNFYPKNSMVAVIKKDLEEEYCKDIICNKKNLEKEGGLFKLEFEAKRAIVSCPQ